MYTKKLCERCTRRNCKSEPTLGKQGYFCLRRIIPKETFPILDMLMDRCPAATLELLWKTGLGLTLKDNNQWRITHRKE